MTVCHCPAAIYMSTVTDVHNDDGSLIVAPNVNSVEVHINTAHSNSWSIFQVFNSGNPLMPAAELQGFAGQTGSYVLTRRSGGTVAWQIRPSPAETVVQQEMFDTAGHLGFSVDTIGNMQLRDTAGTDILQFQTFAGGALIAATHSFTLISLQIESEGLWVFRESAPTSFPHVNAGLVDVAQGPHHGVIVFTVREDQAVGNAFFLTVEGNNGGSADGEVIINRQFAGTVCAMQILKPQASDGLKVLADAAGSSTRPMISTCNSAGAPQLGFREDAALFTTGSLSGSGGITVIARHWPIYDAAGTLLGYIPIMT